MAIARSRVTGDNCSDPDQSVETIRKAMLPSLLDLEKGPASDAASTH